MPGRVDAVSADDRCPTCGRKRPHAYDTPLRRRLASVGDEWQVIRTAASRYLVRENRKRYPQYEWRAYRETLHGGKAGAWTVEARRAR